MDQKGTWEEFFDAHAPLYNENVFTTNTIREADFLIEELGVPPGSSILDVGCGTGRHSVELARRGYRMTGLDLSAEMLARAAEAATLARVEVDWNRMDAVRFAFPGQFDAAICLCEGSFGLLDRIDDSIAQPLSILCNAGARPLGVGSKQESLFLDLLAEAVDREFPGGTRDSIYNACFEGYKRRGAQGPIFESLTKTQRQALEVCRVISALENQRDRRPRPPKEKHPRHPGLSP